MSNRLVKGTLRLVHASASDGDAIWFRPNDPAAFHGLSQRAVRYGQGEWVQLRFEGVDALELRSVEKLGSGEVPGYILTNGVDPHGRPISFVFAEEIRNRDGSNLLLDESLLPASINGQLVARGGAYPMFYTTLPSEVREWLGARMARARAAELGVWAVDRTTSGIRLSTFPAAEAVAVWPKLFRRIARWLEAGVGGSFRAWLASERERDDLMLVDGEEVRMSSLVWEERGLVGMDGGIWGGVVVPR